jgi:hypothetical protein
MQGGTQNSDLHCAESRLDMKNLGRSELICFGLLFLAICLGGQHELIAQEISHMPTVRDRTCVTAEQVVQNLVRMNALRAQVLQAYQGTRIYRLDYRGFPGSRRAEMVVRVKYRSPLTKEFTIVSATGSKLVIEKVFQKLLQAEKEALREDHERLSALDSENYTFKLLGFEPSTPQNGPLLYAVSVEPKARNKFLYRGTVWIDWKDFAVVRIKAEPAKNPSFWTKHSRIEHEYVKVGDFWLPAHNHSVSTVRFGGRADLTIDYTNYEITDARPLGAGLHAFAEQLPK